MWMDLFVDGSSRQTSARLFDQIRDAIVTGRLRARDRVPPSRALAVELGVARSTVAAVYARLLAEGFLDARVGDGTFVADGCPMSPAPARSSATGEAERRVDDVTDLVVRADLRTGSPEPGLFPLVDWRRCVTAAAAHRPPGYGDPAGVPALRRAIASWVSRSRGVIASPGQVLVTSGAQQAFDLIARTLLAPGDMVAIEDPGYPQARRAFERHGRIAVPVAVDHDGIDVTSIPHDVRAVYVTPSHQSPTGVTLSSARRRELLALAARQDMIVIEDDYDTEFRYVDRPIEPLRRLDQAGRVLYVGTFSKTLSPSIRLGFVIAESWMIDDLCATRSVVDAQPPHVTQAALAELIMRGAFDRHLRRARRVYRTRHELVARATQSLHEQGLVPAPWRSNAGLHSMLALDPSTATGPLVERLARRGVSVASTEEWSLEVVRPALLIGFALADIAQLGIAFDEITRALQRPRST
jgi:GntR family transcriptional regulator / MocR family aminotransferase